MPHKLETYFHNMIQGGELLAHLFGIRGPGPVRAERSGLWSEIDERITQLAARFYPDVWDTIDLNLYGTKERGFAEVRGERILRDGHLYATDVLASDVAWVTLGALPPVVIAGNLFCTFDSDTKESARLWIAAHVHARHKPQGKPG